MLHGPHDIAAPLYNRRLACHLLITPAVAERSLSEFMLGQGFLPRFLIARPASKIGFRAYHATDPGSDIRCINFWARMDRLLSLPINRLEGGGCETRTLVLTEEAHELYVTVYNRFEEAMRPDQGLSEATAFASKAAENMARIAAVATLVIDENAETTELSTLADAALLMDKYYLPEALRFIRRAPEDQAIADAKHLLKWIMEHRKGHQIEIRDICRSGPRCARKSATVARRLIGVLVDHGYLLKLAGNSFPLTHEALTGDKGDSGDIPRG